MYKVATKSNERLSHKQQRFVDEYLVDGNATQAAIRAGYSRRTARQIGSENLSKPYIAEAIEQKQAAYRAQVVVTREWIVGQMLELSRSPNASLMTRIVTLGRIARIMGYIKR